MGGKKVQVSLVDLVNWDRSQLDRHTDTGKGETRETKTGRKIQNNTKKRENNRSSASRSWLVEAFM